MGMVFGEFDVTVDDRLVTFTSRIADVTRMVKVFCVGTREATRIVAVLRREDEMYLTPEALSFTILELTMFVDEALRVLEEIGSS